MGLVVGFAAYGVFQLRRGDIAAHRRAMLRASGFVVFFLLSYLTKRFWIGTEDLELWSRGALLNLWIHEAMVATLLIAGIVAIVRGRRLARTRRVTGDAEDPVADPAALAAHRRVGRIAVIASAFGLLTACGILWGMFARTA